MVRNFRSGRCESGTHFHPSRARRWRGFDPTNGCLAGEDHVRVACGRNYRDAAPTSGTIFAGGSEETLRVAVRVEEVPLEIRGAAVADALR